MGIRIGTAMLTLCAALSSCAFQDRERPVAGTAAAQARTSSPAAQPATASFDYYLLTLSWSPQHCATQGQRSRGSELQCAGERQYDFVLHGLWPQYEKGTWREDCSTASVSHNVVESMLDIMPSPTLVRHEWSKHGTCSGLTASQYFAKAREAFQRVRIPPSYQRPRLQVVTRPAEMRQRFAQANPGFAEDSFAVMCSGRFLSEVRVCLTTGGQPRACAASVLRNQCRAPEIILRPVR